MRGHKTTSVNKGNAGKNIGKKLSCIDKYVQGILGGLHR